MMTLVLGFTISSCSSEQSLQEYYIASAENPNFMSFDLPSSLLNLEKANLSESEKEAASSLKEVEYFGISEKT